MAVAFSEDDYAEFLRLVDMGASNRQMDRIEARLQWGEFEKRVGGRVVCDAMNERMVRDGGDCSDEEEDPEADQDD